MKERLKRLLTGVIALTTVLTAIPIQQVEASANNSVLLSEHQQFTYQFDSSYPAPFNYSNKRMTFWTYQMNQNNSGSYKPVYCIEYGVPANTGDTYNRFDDYGFSAHQKKLLQRTLVFGYNEHTGNLYGGSWIDNAMATQAMVWTITGNQYGSAWEMRIVDNLLQSNPAARHIYNQIRANIESYDTIPSFTASSAGNAKDYELKYNMNSGKFELTLEDSTNALKYFDFSASGIHMQRQGNKLILSADTETQFDTITIKANKNLPKDVLPSLISGVPEYWDNATQQDFTSLNVGGSRETVSAYFKLHTEKIGHIKLKKTSEDGIVDNLKFKVSGNGIDRVYTTNEKGEIPINNLVAGEYTITEVGTPNKYVQPKTQVVTVKPAKTTEVSFDNILKKFHIFITKSDEETGNTPQGDATLDGAEYDIYNAQGDFVEHIKANGNMAQSSLHILGTYQIYETVPPTGYTLNTKPITVTGDFAGQTVEVGRADTGITDRVIKGQVAVTKFVDAPLTGDTEDGGVKQPLEHIEFTLTLKSTGEVASKIVTDADGYAITPYLPYGVYRIEETKGADGYRKIEPFDIVINQNGKIYKYILENTVYDTTVKIIKKDAETGRIIPLAGTQFKIKDSKGNWVTQKYNYPTPTVIDTFETAQDGTLVLPESLRYGDYELHEVKAPNGYTVSHEPIKFTVSSDNPSLLLEVTSSNTPVKGTVAIEKLGERFMTADFRMTEYGKLFAPIYELKGLEGISFDIIAIEDIVTPDGTIRYERGAVVDTITTGKNGKVTSKALYLGKYQAVEKNAQDGFVLDKQKYAFELVYQDQNTEIVTSALRIENQRQKAKVSLVKQVEMLCDQNYNPLSAILFGVYAKNDIQTAGGEMGFEKGVLIDVFGVDEKGNGIMNTDIPAGSYYIKEIATGEGYILDEQEYSFTFKHMGQEEPIIAIHANDGKPIENKLMRGNIIIEKTAEDKKIKGISFQITGKSIVGTVYEEIFETNKEGKIHIENLPIGTYTVSEVVDDKTLGYITPERQSVVVKNGETSTVKMENKLIRGGFTLLKVNEKKQPLAEVKFALFQTNGTKLKEFVTDKEGTYSMIDLLYGDYYLKELETVDGYRFDKEAVYAFTVSKDKEVVEITVVNQKIPEKPVIKTSRPKTGDSTDAKAMLMLFGASCVGLTSAYFFKKHKSKKS